VRLRQVRAALLSGKHRKVNKANKRLLQDVKDFILVARLHEVVSMHGIVRGHLGQGRKPKPGEFADDESRGVLRLRVWLLGAAVLLVSSCALKAQSFKWSRFERTLPFSTDGGGNGSARGVGVQFEGRAKRMGG